MGKAPRGIPTIRRWSRHRLNGEWYPSLYEGTTPVAVKKPPEEGYHLMEDMTDKAINRIGQQEAIRIAMARQ